MTQKKTTKTSGAGKDTQAQALNKISKKSVSEGLVHIQATYNNTIITLSDDKGNVLAQASAGAMGFRGTRKSTPYAAAKVAEAIAEKAKAVGMQKAGVKVKGIGSGRESAIRAFAGKGFEIPYIKDVTPLPHNGPKPKKPRRV